jgi:hypothetical protein
MKANLSTLFAAALLASLGSSALAEGNSNIVPPPPPSFRAKAIVAPPAAPLTVSTGPVSVTPLATHVSRSSAAQHFVDEINLKPNQEKIQLRLSVANGAAGSPAFSWFRMRVNGELLFTEKSMKGRREAVVDVSGLIPAGTNQVVIDAGGAPGATMSWQLVTEPMKIVSMEPKTVNPGGVVTLVGENFPSDPNRVNVIVGGSVADVVKTAPTCMTIRLSDAVTKGANNMQIDANGLPPVMVKVNVGGQAVPIVKGTDVWSAAPGQSITIRGKNFSKTTAENQVYFDNVAGQVTSVGDDYIKAVVPNVSSGAPNKQRATQLFVVSNGVRSAESVSFTIGGSALDKNYTINASRFGEGTTQNSSQASSSTSSGASVNSSSQSASTSGSQSVMEASSQSNGFIFVPVDE